MISRLNPGRLFYKNEAGRSATLKESCIDVCSFNFVEFIRTPCLWNTSCRLLLKILWQSLRIHFIVAKRSVLDVAVVLNITLVFTC